MNTLSDQPNLPAEYFAWLDTLPELCYVKFKKQEFDVAPRVRLTETIRFNRDQVPYHAQLTAYVKMWSALGHDSANGPKRSRFPYSRLANCVTIGSDNGDPLFVDPSDGYSVWMLHHDSESGEVQPLAPSLQEWIKNAKAVS